MTRHITDLIASRRTVLGAFAGLPLLNLSGCATRPSPAQGAGFASVAATNADTVTLPPGYRWDTLIAWGDALFDTVSESFDPDSLTRAEQEQRFGQNNDMLALFAAEYAFPPPKDQSSFILCVNNEFLLPALTYPSMTRPAFTPAQVEALFASLGISVVELQRDGDRWRVRRNSAPGQGHNRRITPFSPVRFTGPAARHPWIVAAGAVVNEAEPARAEAPADAVRCGTLANCAGGLTPWGTYLSAEENLNFYSFGAAADLAVVGGDEALARDAASFGYPVAVLPPAIAPPQFRFAENPHGPSLYGWVIEVDPYDVNSTPKKRTALGRKENECATTALARDGRVAVYMGDDRRNEHVYKFVSRARFDPSDRAANMDLLDDGQLYCAQFLENGEGRWLALTVEAVNAAAAAGGSPARFRDQGDVLVRAREAAGLMGATPMDRPEDIEAVCDNQWRGLGPVLIVCTNNSDNIDSRPGNPHRESAEPGAPQRNLAGHILRIDEAGGDCAAERFTWDVFILCGDPNTGALTTPTRTGAPAHTSTEVSGEQTFSGDRFACPDNIFIDSSQRVWIATDGGDSVFADCNDSVMVTPLAADGPRPVRRFLVGPVGAEICGPLMAPDETAFFCAIQHPGGNDVAGANYAQQRWTGVPPPSNFPDGGASWPRSAVIVITRDDGGRIGD